jgi:hypothetical protein
LRNSSHNIVALIEPDFTPEKEFDAFYREDLKDLLNDLQKIIETKSDGLLQH